MRLPNTTHCTRDAAADNVSIMLRLARHHKQMGIFILFLCLIPVSRTEEFAVNITETTSEAPQYSQITSEAPQQSSEASFTQLIDDLFAINETTSSSPVETSSLIASDDVIEGNVTSGARKGRLVNGNWDTRELALQFHGSPVFASGFQPILPPPETVVTATEGISIPAIQTQTYFPAVTQPNLDTHTGNFEDRILNPFAQSVSNIFIKDALRKGPDIGEMGKPSSVFLTGVPPPQRTQNQETKFNLDSNQVALAQAAIQAAHSLFGQVGAGQQLTPAAIEQFQMQNSQVVTENSPWQQQQDLNEKFFNTGSEPPTLLSVNPPSVPPPTIFRDALSENGNKRYGGPQEPFHKYHDLTYSYYAPPPPLPHPPPPHYHHHEPHHHEPYHHPPPPHHHSGGGKNIIGDVTHLFTDLKRNVVGTAHRFGEKVASIASPHKWSSIVPAATTLLVGGLALKLLTSQNSFNSYGGNNSLPLFSFGRRKRSDYFMSGSVGNARPALARRKRRALKGGMKLVFEFQPEVGGHGINKRDLTSGNESTNASASSRADKALDGTFTEDELNSLVTRLDPVQKQFLQKLQWYGFDRWKEMPCAKFILCDVIVHSDYQHIYDLERRIGLFLSLMDDDSARKVEVMIKDLILAIESRDCSPFFCPRENMHGHLSVMPPIHPLPPPVAIHQPTWSNHLPPSYRHPYAFPKTSSRSEST